MKKELFKKESKLLPLLNDIKEHHALLLNHHFTVIELEKQGEILTEFTALPTPNYFYKENIHSLIKHNKESEFTEH